MKRDMDLLRKILLHIEAFSDVPPKVLCVEDFGSVNFLVGLYQ